MKQKSTGRRAMFVAIAVVVLGAATTGTASAKSVLAILTDQNPATPNGTTYSTGSGLAVFAQTNGFDSSGVLNCVTRSFNNHTTTSSPCGSSAVTYQSFVRTVSTNFCTTGQNAWGGLIVACHTGPLPFCSSVAGCNFFGPGIDLGVWGRGQYP